VQPITFELPAAAEPSGILSDAWANIARWYPGEIGGVTEEAAPDLPDGLRRVTLGCPARLPAYELLLTALTLIDIWCRQRWAFPSVYAGSIHYREDSPDREVWASTPALHARGWGDCTDLACDRAAELIFGGTSSTPFLRLEAARSDRDYFHVMVARDDAWIEDPSKALGMLQLGR